MNGDAEVLHVGQSQPTCDDFQTPMSTVARASPDSWLIQQYLNVWEGLNISELERGYLEARWLDQVLWNRRRAAKARLLHLSLRITVLVGGATATAFASLKLSGAAQSGVGWIIFVLTLVTTIAAGLSELLKPDERVKHHEKLAEALTTEGWSYFGLTGPYATLVDLGHHGVAFTAFSSRVEELMRGDAGGSRLKWLSRRTPHLRQASPIRRHSASLVALPLAPTLLQSRRARPGVS